MSQQQSHRQHQQQPQLLTQQHQKAERYTFNVDPDGERDVVLAHGAEQGREVDQPVDPVRHNDLLKILEIQDVGKNEWAWK